MTQAKSILCGGLLKFMIAARKEGKIQIPNPKFDNEEVILYRDSHAIYPLSQ